MTAPGRLDVDVAGLRSADGLIQACLTREAGHFPDCDGDPRAERRTINASAADTLAFVNLPSGSYALSIVHDENANARLDRFAGIPREGIGFSRNPAFTFGPPRFSAARFAVEGSAAMTVRMRYFL